MSTVQNEADDGPNIQESGDGEVLSVDTVSGPQHAERESQSDPSSLAGNAEGDHGRVNVTSFAGFRTLQDPGEDADTPSPSPLVGPSETRANDYEGSLSTPDDSPSVQVSPATSDSHTRTCD